MMEMCFEYLTGFSQNSKQYTKLTKCTEKLYFCRIAAPKKHSGVFVCIVIYLVPHRRLGTRYMQNGKQSTKLTKRRESFHLVPNRASGTR